MAHLCCLDGLIRVLARRAKSFLCEHRDEIKGAADAADEPLTRLRLSLLPAAHDRHRADKLRSLGLMLEKTAAVFERCDRPPVMAE